MQESPVLTGLSIFPVINWRDNFDAKHRVYNKIWVFVWQSPFIFDFDINDMAKHTTINAMADINNAAPTEEVNPSVIKPQHEIKATDNE